VTDAVALEDFEALARGRLDPGAYAYIAGGSWDERTLRANRERFARWALRPRVLVDVSHVDPATTLLGVPVALPVGLAPVAFPGLAHPEAEAAVARAAGPAGVLQCVATLGTRSLEEVAAAAAGPRWFQLYVHRDRARAADLVRRAEAAGYGAIVLTVDLPEPGYRERELRRRYHVPPGTPLGNFAGLDPGATELIAFISSLQDQSLSWSDVAWVRGLSRLPLVVKGVLTAEDAALAVEHGAAGVVVSNHGGRQLDGAPATIDVLEEVVQAVAGRAEVYLDGGVRRGTDALVARALGAQAVFVGRPWVYALAAGGAAGVARMIALLCAELTTAMRLLGVTTMAQIQRAHVRADPGSAQ
jgi:isopentenyl diphosphate isomerase/L-lactate dehydrogenase-like FMN-dependent dehydrogenase